MIEAFLQNGSIVHLDKDKMMIGWGEKIFSGSSVFEPKKPVFYFPDFFLSDLNAAAFNHEYTSLIEPFHLLQKISWKAKEEVKPSFWDMQGKEHFLNSCKDLIALFKEKSAFIKKAVPYLFSESSWELTKGRLAAGLKAVIEESTPYPLFIYGTWDDKKALLGATPEILFNFDKSSNHLETAALAGTLDLKTDLKKNLKLNEKTMEEHSLVAQGIEQSLFPYGEVKIGQMKETLYGNLKHYYTPISLACKNSFPFWEMINILHPTPALGVYPKDSGFQWLKDYNQILPRGNYGAPCGVDLPDGKSYCYVAIRGLQWEDQKLKIGAGSGIVKDSCLDEEWKEINLKITMIKKLFRL